MNRNNHNLPQLGFLYLDYVLRFFDYSNFKGWPNKIESVTYHWKNDKQRFINEVKRKKIDILIGNIPATAYDTFREISQALPHVRFVPSLQSQFSNKSKENVTLFCQKHRLSIPKTKIFRDKTAGYHYLKHKATYPQIIKRSYGPSNYGGYYVHKVNHFNEAQQLLEKKKYHPIYTQDAIDLKHSGDLRIMLIGHKPICAFWRFSGKGEWITNTSQGGTMSYNNVPMEALELAVKASKAAKAEYWACDIAIDAKTNKPYILECATAFAAFPYIRDWICQYLMWDFSNGLFKKPHIPLFSWEELGKIDSNLLRTMRHIGFSQYKPSYDGEYILNDQAFFMMEKTHTSTNSDYPEEYINHPTNPSYQPKNITYNDQEETLDFNTITLTQLMSLCGVDEALALEILTFIKTNTVNEYNDLLEIESVTPQMIQSWEESTDSMKINLNHIDLSSLIQLEGISQRIAHNILKYKQINGSFKDINELRNIEGIGSKRFNKLLEQLKV